MTLRKLANKKGGTLSQLAPAWILAHGKKVLPIPDPHHPERLKENLKAFEVELTPEDLIKIKGTLCSFDIQGSRYASPIYAVQNNLSE